MNQPGDDINLLNLRAEGQAANEIKNVERLTTGISIPAQLKIAGSKQAMEMGRAPSLHKRRNITAMPYLVFRGVPPTETEKKVMNQPNNRL